ncbi:MAG: hypothetical protein ACLS48_13965 [[Eubacterium] siraeum]
MALIKQFTAHFKLAVFARSEIISIRSIQRPSPVGNGVFAIDKLFDIKRSLINLWSDSLNAEVVCLIRDVEYISVTG